MTLPLFDEMGAIFSDCLLYRYRLWRYWDRTKPHLVFLMLNPSTADELKNDPTVERCEVRARTMGFGGLEVVNIFAYRATDPGQMLSQKDPIGPDNNQAILDAIKGSGMVVCAWGNHGGHLNRGKEVATMLREYKIPLYCLKTSQGGHPGHPLYIGYGVKPVVWKEPS
jgi:hypothetical protein